jgi:PHD/YefM family antitoxin component YafN of YafNO toxin-antitoxin module
MLDVKHLEIEYVTNKAGDKTAVILPIDEFEELMEDIEDLAAVAERREEPTISHEQLLAELKQDGKPASALQNPQSGE